MTTDSKNTPISATDLQPGSVRTLLELLESLRAAANHAEVFACLSAGLQKRFPLDALSYGELEMPDADPSWKFVMEV